MEQLETERELIRRKVEGLYEPGYIKRTYIYGVDTQFDIGNVYYVEFDIDEQFGAQRAGSKEVEKDAGEEQEDGEEEADDEDSDESDQFCYVLVAGTNVEVFDDGLQVIQALNTKLQRTKSFCSDLAISRWWTRSAQR